MGGSWRTTRVWLAAAVVLAALAALPAASSADVIVGSSLASAPTVAKEATADSVYWTQTLANGSSAAVPVAGTVKSITVRGYWTGVGHPNIAFQVLRPQPDGSLLVVATSQPFELPTTPGTYTFMPVNMTVQPGDFIGLATIGGNFVIGVVAPAASTNDFTGHEKDNNGDTIRPTKVESGVEVDQQVDIVEKPREEPPSKKKEEAPAKPCECQNISARIDGTLLKKRHLPADKHSFGIGFIWRMTCTKGAGGCTATLKFSPPAIRAGKLPAVKGLKLALTSLTFICKTACQTSTEGRFEIKMSSRSQLKKLFGRTLAFTITTTCAGASFRYKVAVLIDDQGRLHGARS